MRDIFDAAFYLPGKLSNRHGYIFFAGNLIVFCNVIV